MWPLLIKNSIPMGIEKLNKKNPPTLASPPSATSTEVEVLVYITSTSTHLRWK